MSFILLGKKLGMTQVYDETNTLVPVTVVEAGPCVISQLRTEDKDGYSAVQVAFSEQKASRLAKPQLGQFEKTGIAPHSTLKEFRTDDISSYTVGDTMTVEKFESGSKVDVIATTKGRGFQGVVKRWGFAGGPASHGSMFHRRGGSYGMCQWPGHVIKGKKMPGHMGAKSRTTQNLRVVKVIPEKNIILIRGSFAGGSNTLVTIRPAKKTKVAK
ncbi:MAG: 50S ribosomal protein L3 [Verrucomicrobiota bacterium]